MQNVGRQEPKHYEHRRKETQYAEARSSRCCGSHRGPWPPCRCSSVAVLPSGGWTDLSYSIVGKYGITLEQVGMISDGYTDGSWRPWNNIPRNQFTKMAVDAYKIPLKNPATPSFSDVPASDI